MKPWEMKRRTFLKGMGVSIALPVLDTMIPSMARAQTATAPRFAAIFCPTGAYGGAWDPSKNGTAVNGKQGVDRYFAAPTTSDWGGTAWRPRTVGALPATLPPITDVFKNVKDKVAIVSGLSLKVNAHTAVTTWLSGDKVYADEAEYNHMTTIDQEIANRFGYVPGSTIVFNPTAGGFPHFGNQSFNTKLGGSNICPKTNDPKKKFNQLFGSCDPNVMSQLTAAQQNNKSVLDFVADSIASVQSRLGKDDKARLDAYLTNVRELEKRLTAAGPSKCPTMPTSDPVNASGSLVHVSVDNMMVDVMALAMASDAMPIATLMLDNEAEGSAEYAARIGYQNDFVGVNGQVVGFPTSTTEWHFDVSHHANAFDRIESLIAMNRYHMKYLLRLINKLNSMPAEPNGLTPLDNSLLLSGIPLSDGNDHVSSNVPTVVAGGKKYGLKTGQHLSYPMNTDYGCMLLTMMQAMGIQISDFNGANKSLTGMFG